MRPAVEFGGELVGCRLVGAPSDGIEVDAGLVVLPLGHRRLFVPSAMIMAAAGAFSSPRPAAAQAALEASDGIGAVARIVGLALAAAEIIGAILGRELHAGVAGAGRDQLDRPRRQRREPQSFILKASVALEVRAAGLQSSFITVTYSVTIS